MLNKIDFDMQKIMNYVKSFVIAAMMLTSVNVWGQIWTWTGELPLKDSYHYLYTSYCDKFLQSDASGAISSGNKGLSLKDYKDITTTWRVAENNLNSSNEYRLYENNGNILVLSNNELNIQKNHTLGVGKLKSTVLGNYCTIRASSGSGQKQMASKADGTGVERINSDDSKTEWLFVTETELTAYKNYRKAYAKLAAYIIPTGTTLYAEVTNVLAMPASHSNSATIISTFEALSSVCEAYLAAVATCNAFEGEYASKTCDATTAAADLAAARSALNSATSVAEIETALNNLRKFDEISWGVVPTEIIVTKTLSTIELASAKSEHTITYSASNDKLSLSGTTFTAEASGDVKVIAQTATTSDYYAVRSESSSITVINKLTTEWTANYADAAAFMFVGDQIANAFMVKDGGSYVTTITPTGIISFEGNVISALNAGSAVVKFEQEANDDYFASSASFEFTVSKIANTLAVAAAEKTLLVEDEWGNVMSGKNSDAEVITTTTDSELAYYDVENNRIVVPNSGNKASGSTATIHIKQAETYKYTGIDKEVIVTVDKHTPTFTQRIASCGINSVIALSDFFKSDANTELTYTSLDSKTAVIGDNLYVYDATGTAQVKVSQAENYYWNGKEETFNLTINRAKTAADWCWKTETPQNGQKYYFYTVNQNKFLNDNNGLDASLNTQWLFLGNAGAYSFRSQNGKMLCIYDESWKYNVVSNADGIKKNANDTIMASALQNGKYSLYRSANQGIAAGNSNRNVYSTNSGLAIQADASHEWLFISTTGDQFKAYSNYQTLTNYVSTKTVSEELKNTAVAALSANDCESDAAYGDKATALGAVIRAYDAYFELIDYVNTSSADLAAKDRIINELLPTKTTAEGILALKDEIKLTPAFAYNYEGVAFYVNDVQQENNETAALAPFSFANTDNHLSFEITNNTPSGVTVGSNHADEIIGYDPATNTLTAYNAGTATITFAQEETDAIYTGSKSFEITVVKRDVTYEVTVPEVYHNRTLNGYIISSNKECMFSTMTSSNEAVATLSQDAMYPGKLTVTTTLAEGSTTITLAQPENYQWNASGEKTFTITPTTASNHVPFIVNSSKVYSSLVAEQHYSRWNGDGTDWNKEIRVGEDNGFSWDDKYVVLHFEGIPDKMSFNCALTGTSTGRDYRVFESADGKNFGTEIWSSTDQDPSVSDLQLQPTTRYIKLFYSGNYCAYWHNVSVTELKYFRTNVTSLDFGSNQRKAVPAAQSFAFQYCNTGTVVTVTAPAEYEVSLDGENYAATQNLNSDLIGADKMGKATIYVRYLAPEVGTHAGNLSITDNADHSVTVSLTGTTVKADRTIVWDIAAGNEIVATQSLDLTAYAKTDYENPAGEIVYTYESTTADAATITGNHIVFHKEATVTVYANTVTNDQYNDAAPVYKTWTVKKNSVKLEVAEGFITNEKITYGDQGSTIRWDAAKLTHVDELDNTKVVEGTITYSSPAQFNQAGEVNVTFNFTPTDLSAYDAKSFTVPVTVQKKASVATPSAAAITYGQKVSESVLSNEGEGEAGTWTWADAIAESVPTAGTHEGLAVHFTPTNTNMTELDATVSLTVNKATAELSWSEAPSELAFEDGTATYTATSSSEATITYTITAGEDKAEVNAATGELTILKPGSFTLQASQAEGANFLAPAAITVDVTIANPANNIFIGTINGDWSNPKNWSAGIAPETTANENVTIQGNLTISTPITVGSLTIEENAKVTLTETGSLTTTGSSETLDAYGDLIINAGGVVSLGNTLNIRNLEINSELGNRDTPARSSNLIGEEHMTLNGDAYFDIKMDPTGTITYGYYTFALPFEVDALNGIYWVKPDGSTQKLVHDQDYAILSFSESVRAAGQYAWSWYSGTLQAGVCYSITLDSDRNYNNIRFVKKADSSITNHASATLASTGTSETRGWNGIGNGTLVYTDLQLDNVEKVQIYDHTTNTYAAFNKDAFSYVIGSSFFVQVDAAQTATFVAATAPTELRAPTREENRSKEFAISMTKDGNAIYDDMLYVSASDEATNRYQIGHDLTKMGTPTEAGAAQIWGTSYGKVLCDVELPWVEGQAIFPISIYAPLAGAYELEAIQLADDADLYLTQNGNPIWNLSETAYTLNLGKGTTSEYGLLLIHRAPGVATDIDTLTQSNNAEKIIFNNKVYILRNGMIFDATGKRVQ